MSGVLAAAVRMDFRLQRRYGFWYATAFVVLLWIGVLQLVPDALIGPAMPYLLMADLAFMMFFIAGAVFFEKGERTVFALLTTPLRFRHYLTAKLLTMSALALVTCVVVVLVDYGPGVAPLPFLAGVVLMTLLMLLAGFVTAPLFPSISEWILPSTARARGRERAHRRLLGALPAPRVLPRPHPRPAAAARRRLPPGRPHRLGNGSTPSATRRCGSPACACSRNGSSTATSSPRKEAGDGCARHLRPQRPAHHPPRQHAGDGHARPVPLRVRAVVPPGVTGYVARAVRVRPRPLPLGDRQRVLRARPTPAAGRGPRPATARRAGPEHPRRAARDPGAADHVPGLPRRGHDRADHVLGAGLTRHLRPGRRAARSP